VYPIRYRIRSDTDAGRRLGVLPMDVGDGDTG
jgi:hypothetical protein